MNLVYSRKGQYEALIGDLSHRRELIEESLRNHTRPRDQLPVESSIVETMRKLEDDIEALLPELEEHAHAWELRGYSGPVFE